MTSIQNENIKRCVVFFQKLPWLAGERLFLSLLVSTVVTTIAGAAIFYQYAVLVPKAEPQAKQEVIRFETARFWDLVAKWEARQARFDNALEKNYSDPFQ